MSFKPTRRDILISGAAITAIPAIGGSSISQTVVAQTTSSSKAMTSSGEPRGSQIDAYMGAPVELGKAPNGAITNKKLLYRAGEIAWLEPTIEQPAEGIWTFGGYGLASACPLSAISGHRRNAKLPRINAVRLVAIDI